MFRTTARALEVPGFLEALGMEEGRGTELPPLVPGADTAAGVEALVERVEDEEKQTRPPGRHTEAALLRLMETAGERLEDEDLLEAMRGRGLGTPATRAETIERLIQTGYATRVEGKLAPTPKAMRLMDILDRAHVPVLASARLTGEWEHTLKQVESGQMERQRSLDGLVSFTREMTTSLAKFDYDALYADEPALGPCPSCGQGQVIETVWGYRCTRNLRADDEAGCRFFLWKERSGRYVDRKLAGALVRERRAEHVVGFIDRFGRALEGRIVLEPESPDAGAQWNMRVEYGDQPDGAGAEASGGVVFPCPCGAEDCGGVVETSQRYVCERMLQGRAKAGPVLPRVVCSRPIELEEAAAFFGEEGGTPFLEGFISRRGRPFKGRLVRRESGKHAFEFPERPEGARRGRKPEADPKRAKAPAEGEAKPKRTRKAAEAPAEGEAKPKRTRKAAEA
ncbi:MAG TPA: DNA topoisomerase, partial [Myxococcota bacterium]|nr:DNA topoisomerase [Myxococcota bacterium]